MEEMRLTCRATLSWTEPFAVFGQSHVSHRNRCCVGRARLAALAMLFVRKYRQSELNRLQKDLVCLLAKTLWETRGDYDVWWDTFVEKLI